MPRRRTLLGIAVFAGLLITAYSCRPNKIPPPSVPAKLVLATPEPAATKPVTGPSGPLDQWRVVSGAEIPTCWQLAWLGNTFVGVGNAGTLLTSPDGVTWTSQTTKTNENIYGLGYNGKLYVVVGDNGTLLTSPDLKEWISQKSKTTDRLFGVVWMGTQFVVVGDHEMTTSPDGLTWTSISLASKPYFHHGLWNGSEVILATAYGIVHSTNGSDWLNALRTSNRVFEVCFSGKLYVAVGEKPGVLFTSVDGKSWAEQSFSASVALNDIAWTGNQFVACGAEDTLISSPDGVTWTVYHTGTGSNLRNIAAHGDVLVVATSPGKILVNKKMEQVQTPKINLTTGTPEAGQQVQLICLTPGAKIYYTLDGTEPTTTSLPYSAPLSLVFGATIKARAYKDGMTDSDMAVAQFTPGGM